MCSVIMAGHVMACEEEIMSIFDAMEMNRWVSHEEAR